ncbi:MAG: 4Fe-4S binding protein [Coriobacteriia bacterium]
MKWDISKINEWKAEEFPRAAVIPECGNSDDYDVGGWRSERPWRDPEVCTQCMLCWVFCPDSAVLVEDEKMVGFDLTKCKGCGICASECPKNPKFDGRKAIEMVLEGCEVPGVKKNG